MVVVVVVVVATMAIEVVMAAAGGQEWCLRQLRWNARGSSDIRNTASSEGGREAEQYQDSIVLWPSKAA